MKTPESETRRALARLRRAIEKAKREVRRLLAELDESEVAGYPADDYAEIEDHLCAVTELVNREQARQQAKVLRAGGIGPGRLQRSGGLSVRAGVDGEGGRRP